MTKEPFSEPWHVLWLLHLLGVLCTHFGRWYLLWVSEFHFHVATVADQSHWEKTELVRAGHVHRVNGGPPVSRLGSLTPTSLWVSLWVATWMHMPRTCCCAPHRHTRRSKFGLGLALGFWSCWLAYWDSTFPDGDSALACPVPCPPPRPPFRPPVQTIIHYRQKSIARHQENRTSGEKKIHQRG